MMEDPESKSMTYFLFPPQMELARATTDQQPRKHGLLGNGQNQSPQIFGELNHINNI